jgi:hypothetical protein
MAVNADEAREILRFLADNIVEGQEAVLRCVREELRRRLREGEPWALWAAAEVFLECQVEAAWRGLHAAAAYLNVAAPQVPPPPPHLLLLHLLLHLHHSSHS